MTVPPRPTAEPRAGQRPGAESRIRNKTGGGFNPSGKVEFHKTTVINNGPASSGGPGPGPRSGGGGDDPGSDFMSNEDIYAFCEHLRKESRNRATRRAMDADHLEAVLRNIPAADGSRSGSRARARRVVRGLKVIAAAEKVIQKSAASVYATFEKEFESELRKIGKARTQQNPRTAFNWQR